MYGGIKLGLCPIGKFAFSHPDALRQTALIREKLAAMDIEYVGIEAAVEDGIIRSYEDAEHAASHLARQGIDCLFIPHVNFGTESSAALVARKLGVPTLLWGPQDGAPLADGTRLRDTLCGLFATSRVLVKMRVPFSYIENCELSDPAFERGLDDFLRASSAVCAVRNVRIGLVGNRIDFFWSTIYDESALLQKFGIEVLPIDLVSVVRQTLERARKDGVRYRAEARALSIDRSRVSDDGMANLFALRDVMYEFAVSNNLRALAVETFMSLIRELGVCVSFALSMVSDMGIPCACESDIHGAISALIADRVALDQGPGFFADLTVRHPENPDGILLWHDAFPLSLRDPESPASLGGHWILPDFEMGMCHWRIRSGDLTILRFDGDEGQYRLLGWPGKTIDGPFTQNTHVWAEAPDFKALERTVIYGPYLHHVACAYGSRVGALREVARHLGIAFDEP